MDNSFNFRGDYEDLPSSLVEQIHELDQLLAKTSWEKESPSDEPSDDDFSFDSEVNRLNTSNFLLKKELKEAEFSLIENIGQINDDRDDDNINEFERASNGPLDRDEEFIEESIGEGVYQTNFDSTIQEESSTQWENFSSEDNVFRSFQSYLDWENDPIQQKLNEIRRKAAISKNESKAKIHLIMKTEAVEDLNSDDNERFPRKKFQKKDPRKWKRSRLTGLLVFALQITVHAIILKEFISYITSHHSVDMKSSSGSMNHTCVPKGSCKNAAHIILDDLIGYKKVNGTTTDTPNNGIQEENCGVSDSSIWYTLIGTGNKFTAMINSTSDDFAATFSVFEGSCDDMERLFTIQYSETFSKRVQSWETIKGQTYSLAVFGSIPDTTGSFDLKIWDAQYAKALLAKKSESNQKTFTTWALVCSIGVVSLFFLMTILG